MRTSILVAASLAASFGAAAQQIPIEVRDPSGAIMSATTEIISGMVIIRLNGSSTEPSPVEPSPVEPSPVEPSPVEPSPSTCGPVPANVTVVDTGSASVNYNSTIHRPGVNDITAFKFTVPATGTTIGRFTATKTSSATLSKLVSISECPGTYNPPLPSSTRCWNFSTEVSQMIFSTRTSDAAYRCVVEPGKTYYVNAVNRASLDGTTNTCTTSSNCSFYAQRDKL